VLIIFALFMFVLVGALALSVDTGLLMAERRQSQSAADAGAMAAAIAWLRGEPFSGREVAGKAYGAYNAKVSADDVDVYWPPINGAYAGNDRYVEVVVTKDVQKFFVAAIYSGEWQVQSRAVAGIEMEQKPYALLALGCDDRNPGIYINGTTDVFINSGSIMANCSIESSGGSNVLQAGDTIDAHDSIDGNDNWSAPGGIRSGLDPVPDPLAGTPKPPDGPNITTTTLADAGFTETGPKWVCPNGSTCTLPPGHYDDLGEIQAGGTIILSPGIYVFDGDTTLSLSNTDSWIKGDGVLLYFAEDSSASIDAGNGNIDLSAPCLETTPSIPSCSGLAAYSGGADGITLWIDNCTEFVSGGNGVFRVEGVIYAPCSFVQLHGTPDSNGLQVIVFTLKLVGTSSFTLNYREFVEADTPRVFLVE
jgi:hypothetical protein